MYYRVLNCGLKCSASSGSDSRMDVMRHAVSGGGKVYVQMDGPLTYPKWIAGYKAGRTFVSNGPMLFLTVDGKGPGSDFAVPAGGKVRVSARAQSIVPMGKLELIVNGKVAAEATPSPGGKEVTLDQTLTVAESSWIAARVTGEGHRLVVNDPAVFAHTSPVYCRVGGRRIAFAEDARLVVAWIDRLLEDVKASPRFSTEARRKEVVDLFLRGRDYYQRIVTQ